MTRADELVKIIDASKIFFLIVGILVGSFALSMQATNKDTLAGIWIGMANTIVTFYFWNRYAGTKLKDIINKMPKEASIENE
jgi:hypothetical protein